MRSFILFCLLITAMLTRASDNRSYSVSDIPAELLKNANVVKRLEEIRFEIISLNKSVSYKKIVLTILNKRADGYATIFEHYSKLHTVKSIEGTLFNASGEKIKTLKRSEIIDQSAISDISLYEDSRIKYHNFHYKLYPYTIEYIIESEFDGSLFIPDWNPRPAEFYSVQKSSIQITSPKATGLRFKAYNLTMPVQQTQQNENLVYSASIDNLEAMVREPYQPYLNEISPTVFFAPNDFKYADWKGSFSSWQSFGNFQNTLNAGRDILPDYIKADVHQIAGKTKDVHEKIAALYKYMQKNTRYISIQLGIGGLQPFEASYVAEKKYGDCKALSNYMYALLKEAGIKSCYTIVRAGNDFEDKFSIVDFPKDYFNHIILAVPLPKDTVWLECTDQTMPAGYLSNFTQNRYVLMVDENGGKLVRTPKYGFKENRTLRKIEAELDKDGNLKIKARSSYFAMQQDHLEQKIKYLSPEKFKELLKKEIDLPNYDVVNFNYTQNYSALPSIDEELGLQAMNYASVSGKRIFIEPNILNKSRLKLLDDTVRKYSVILDDEFTDTDSVVINIPEGFMPESIPEDVSISCKFGNYKSQSTVEGEKIIYFRTYEKFSGKFSAPEYNELVKFTNAIFKSDRSKIVLVKKEVN